MSSETSYLTTQVPNWELEGMELGKAVIGWFKDSTSIDDRTWALYNGICDAVGLQASSTDHHQNRQIIGFSVVLVAALEGYADDLLELMPVFGGVQ